jgi:crotonobetainyl-CoA:carnitine CoA-transferase CaiB-like acyl-CoA transferase
VTDRPTGPLSGLLVADFSRVLAGPYATMLLADLGADVVKVESPGGDDTRAWTPPVRDGVSTYYLAVNRNKRSVALDLKDDHDQGLARELSSRADVMIENFKPGGLDRFGLGYTDIAAANPGIVYASISGFGTTEQGRVLPGYDLIVQAMSGLMSLTGSPDTEPFRSGISVFDVMAGMHATIGILAALNARHASGRGQHVEVNLLSSALSGMVNQTSAYVAAGVVPQRMGNSHPSLYPYEPIPCADGELIITSGNDAQFRKLCEVLGVPELPEDPRFARMSERNAHRDELRPLLVERLSTRTKMEWFREIIAAGVPCGPINTVDGGVAFAEEIGLEPVVEVGEGEAMVPSVRDPIKFSETPVDYRLPPPALDEHGDDIRRWLAEGSGAAGFETGARAPSSTSGTRGTPSSTGGTRGTPSSTSGTRGTPSSTSGTRGTPSSTSGSPVVEDVALRRSRNHRDDGAADG